jgi:hypothetical protein
MAYWRQRVPHWKERPVLRADIASHRWPLLKHGAWDGAHTVVYLDDYPSAVVRLIFGNSALKRQMVKMYLEGFWGPPRGAAPVYSWFSEKWRPLTDEERRAQALSDDEWLAWLLDHGYTVGEVAR